MNEFIAEDPATGGTVGRVPAGGPAEATGAVDAATRAAVADWAGTPPRRRSESLHRAFETAVAVTGIGGTTVTVGLPSPSDSATINPLDLTAEARVIVGSYLGSAVPSRDIPQFAQMWREGRLPVGELISSTISLTDINSAMDHLADGSAIRQIILFEEADQS